MKKEEIYGLIRKPYNREFLRLIKMGHNIREIQKDIGFSYKSAFKRVKEMEEKELIIVERSGKANNIIINPKYLELVDKELKKYRKLNREFKSENNPELTKKFLKLIKDSRFSDMESIWERLDSEKEREYFIKIKDKLKELGYIKERLEITKKGIKYVQKAK